VAVLKSTEVIVIMAAIANDVQKFVAVSQEIVGEMLKYIYTSTHWPIISLISKALE